MDSIIYQKQGHIAYITLNQPQNLNAIDREMTQELGRVWVDFRDDDALWVAVLAANGRSFAPGPTSSRWKEASGASAIP